MLVLSRKVDERIVVTDTATGVEWFMVISEIRGDKVRIGFEAPDSIRFRRSEVPPDMKGGLCQVTT